MDIKSIQQPDPIPLSNLVSLFKMNEIFRENYVFVRFIAKNNNLDSFLVKLKLLGATNSKTVAFSRILSMFLILAIFLVK